MPRTQRAQQQRRAPGLAATRGAAQGEEGREGLQQLPRSRHSASTQALNVFV
jgi:hypothetical protein